MVVDLAVEHDNDIARLVVERLIAMLDVHDRESPHSQRDRFLFVEPLSVRTAVGHRGGHLAHQLCVDRATPLIDAGYAAHAGLLPSRLFALVGFMPRSMT